MDTLGPLEECDTYCYILVVVDVATRFLWIRPLHNKTAKEVAKELILIWTDFGVCYKLSSDNRTEFCK